MDDDVKMRFEDLDKRLAGTEKRIDDIKWFIGGITGLFTIVFGLVGLSANLNFNNERTSIREDVKDFKAELRGQAEKPPQIEILADDGLPLVNHDVNGELHKDDKSAKWQLNLSFIFRNSGESVSGPLYMKVYAVEPIQFSDKSTDESKFQYEAIHSPETLHPDQIPGGKFSFESQLFMELQNPQRPPAGKYPALIKVFYGKGQVTQANFTLVVPPV